MPRRWARQEQSFVFGFLLVLMLLSQLCYDYAKLHNSMQMHDFRTSGMSHVGMLVWLRGRARKTECVHTIYMAPP